MFSTRVWTWRSFWKLILWDFGDHEKNHIEHAKLGVVWMKSTGSFSSFFKRVEKYGVAAAGFS